MHGPQEESVAECVIAVAFEKDMLCCHTKALEFSCHERSFWYCISSRINKLWFVGRAAAIADDGHCSTSMELLLMQDDSFS
mmetsp:Transcript_14332/g.30767  ORF Transcript_14332/g.30767 Transcript_14332/m.30767 type:complete len:81 (+) Transcript_14332:636-878(+)